jgi:hypothetical protein
LEVTVPAQPLITNRPDDNLQLPRESDILGQGKPTGPEAIPVVLVSAPLAVAVGGFGRTAQAAMLCDEILKAFTIPNLESRIIQLDNINSRLQSFLRVVMKQENCDTRVYCGAMVLAIR